MDNNLPRVIDKKTLLQMVPYSPQHILRLEKDGKFPLRIPIGPNKNGWFLSEIIAWIEEKAAKRKNKYTA